MSNGRSILIVDSNPGFATLLKESLEQDGGYHATVMSNGDDALQALSTTEYDLAIVDLGLEDPDGAALARTMRQQKDGLRLMLIPIQGEELPSEVSDLSVQGVLPKPFFLPELPERIASALAKSVGPVTETPEETPTDDKAKDTVREVKRVADHAEATQPEATDVEPVTTGSTEPLADVREHIPEIVQNMNELARDVNAAAVLLTCKGRLLSHTGHIAVEEAMGLAQAATENWRTATRVATILGQDLVQFEQSTEGGEHVFYSLAIIEDIILSIALNTHVPLGMIRHRAKGAADVLRTLLGGTK